MTDGSPFPNGSADGIPPPALPPTNDPLLRTLFARFPAVAEWRREAQGTVLEVVRQDLRPPGPPGISPVLRGHIRAAAERHFGPDIATKADKRLRDTPHVLMAQHHGINCHPEFIQATLMFALPELLGQAGDDSVAPVLACSSVALRSYSYPRGLLLARRPDAGGNIRLPLFPASQGDTLVSAAPPLCREQLLRALLQWKTLGLTAKELRAAMDLAEEHLLVPDVLDLTSFSDQITRINASTWRALCGPKAPALLFLDMEHIATALLAESLRNGDSLFSRLLLDSGPRRELCARLAGVPGCWPEPGRAETAGTGTAFFWLSRNGRRRRFVLRESPEPCLVAQDTLIPLTRDALLEGLETKRLIPGLYCSCMLLSYVHGLLPHGGMYMMEYLPRMRRATHAVARQLGLAATVQAAFPQAALGTALMPLRVRQQPAWACGLVELLPFRHHLPDALRQIAKMAASKVSLFAFADWWLESTAQANRSDDWPEALAQLLAHAEGFSVPQRPHI
ncbi:hypothetical protein LJB82_03640 [Desulfovibrio sp. OttesenSCG-928-M16]|nr:hypothetical protein [Desulfovibrio sp. OttesenSCG-928-M16]